MEGRTRTKESPFESGAGPSPEAWSAKTHIFGPADSQAEAALRIVPFKALKVVGIRARVDKIPVRAGVKLLPIGSAGVVVRGFGPFASGMAARKGEDPACGASAQPTARPAGRRPIISRSKTPRRHGYDELRAAIRFLTNDGASSSLHEAVECLAALLWQICGFSGPVKIPGSIFQ